MLLLPIKIGQQRVQYFSIKHKMPDVCYTMDMLKRASSWLDRQFSLAGAVRGMLIGLFLGLMVGTLVGVFFDAYVLLILLIAMALFGIFFMIVGARAISPVKPMSRASAIYLEIANWLFIATADPVVPERITIGNFLGWALVLVVIFGVVIVVGMIWK